MRLLSYVFLVLLFFWIFAPSRFIGYQKEVSQIHIIDETVAGDLEPGIEQGVWEAIGVLQQALEQRAPAWAQYRVETVENPVHPLQGSLAEYIWDQAHAPLTLVNPRVLLVTAGVALDWQIPQDRSLPDAISEVGGELREQYLAFRFDPQVRAQYPHVTNAASYALYAFFRVRPGEIAALAANLSGSLWKHHTASSGNSATQRNPAPFYGTPLRTTAHAHSFLHAQFLSGS